MHSLLTSVRLGSVNGSTGSCTVVESLGSCPASTPVRKILLSNRYNCLMVKLFQNYMGLYKYPTQLLYRPHIWLRFLAHPLNSPGEWGHDEKLSHSLVWSQQAHSGQQDFSWILQYPILKLWNVNGILFRIMTFLLSHLESPPFKRLILIYLKGRMRERQEQRRGQSAICWFTLQLPTAARTELGQSRTWYSSKSPTRMAGAQAPALSHVDSQTHQDEVGLEVFKCDILNFCITKPTTTICFVKCIF